MEEHSPAPTSAGKFDGSATVSVLGLWFTVDGGGGARNRPCRLLREKRPAEMRKRTRTEKRKGKGKSRAAEIR